MSSHILSCFLFWWFVLFITSPLCILLGKRGVYTHCGVLGIL